jgi:eukaryotic-like serine/threonine-protein kinase
MLTFIRGEETFIGAGHIYAKLLPSGDPRQLTHDGLQKMSPVFDPSGTRILYTGMARGERGGIWSVPVLGGDSHAGQCRSTYFRAVA